MPVIESTARLKTLQAEYDFDVDGGATSTITLRAAPGDNQGNTLPAGAVITGGYIDVLTAVASATGTVALTAESAADVLAATGQAGLTLGRKDIIPDASGSTAVKTTVVRSVTMTIATAALTAGKFRLVLFYK